MKISTITSVGWCATILLDQRRAAPFSFDDIYRAADNQSLVELFLKMDQIEGTGIIELSVQSPVARQEMEEVFSNAVEALRGREIRKTGVGDNPLCMVLALVLEATQQNWNRTGHA
jgi:hypothetical protein